MKNKAEKLAAIKAMMEGVKKSSPVLSITIAKAEPPEDEEEDEDVAMEHPDTTKKRRV